MQLNGNRKEVFSSNCEFDAPKLPSQQLTDFDEDLDLEFEDEVYKESTADAESGQMEQQLHDKQNGEEDVLNKHLECVKQEA